MSAISVLVVGGLSAGMLLTIGGGGVQVGARLQRTASSQHASSTAAVGLGHFVASTAKGEAVSLADPPYNARVALVVNVASE